MPKHPITIARGDGIGPEIMEATLSVLRSAGADLEIEEIDIGEHLYKKGISSGIAEDSWDSLKQTKVFLKAPITTPQGKGVKSLNVTIRKSLGLYANVRPCPSYSPFIHTKHPHMNVTIIRENEEGLYGGIEHQQTPEVVQALKLFSLPGCERIIRFAFEYATHFNRKKITCFTKDNIMKLTDGMFHKVFLHIAKEYPEIEPEHMIIDIGSARLADTPEYFDVIVTPNLYGDIVSDIAAQIAGSVGLAGSANIGESCAMFEAIHGSAPPLAGKDLANPSGLLHAAILMLVHIHQPDVAETIHNAWLKTIEEGIHTSDIYQSGISQMQVGTLAFTHAIRDRLGKEPHTLSPIRYPKNLPEHTSKPYTRNTHPLYHKHKTLDGVDIFVQWSGEDPNELAKKLQPLSSSFKLAMISNRGTVVWPKGHPETFCTDHWRCRFLADKCQAIEIASLYRSLVESNIDVIKTENLYRFNEEPGYTKGQGQ